MFYDLQQIQTDCRIVVKVSKCLLLISILLSMQIPLTKGSWYQLISKLVLSLETVKVSYKILTL